MESLEYFISVVVVFICYKVGSWVLKRAWRNLRNKRKPSPQRRKGDSTSWGKGNMNNVYQDKMDRDDAARAKGEED